MSLAFAGGYFTTEPPGNPYHGSEIYYTRKWFSKSGPWRFYQQHYLRPYKCKILSSTLELLNQRQELALSLCFKNSSRGLGCTLMFEDHWRRYVGGGMSEKAMAPHSSTLAWKIPWAEEPGRLQSMGSRRVRHNWATSLSLFTFMHWRRKWKPTPVFLPGESQGQRSLVGCRLWGLTESDTTEAT